MEWVVATGMNGDGSRSSSIGDHERAGNSSGWSDRIHKSKPPRSWPNATEGVRLRVWEDKGCGVCRTTTRLGRSFVVAGGDRWRGRAPGSGSGLSSTVSKGPAEGGTAMTSGSMFLFSMFTMPHPAVTATTAPSTNLRASRLFLSFLCHERGRHRGSVRAPSRPLRQASPRLELTRRSRSALAMTDTELTLIAALASMGLSRTPNHG